MEVTYTGKNTAIKKEYSVTTEQQDTKLPAENDLIDSKDKVSDFFVEDHVIRNFTIAPQISSTECCA